MLNNSIKNRLKKLEAGAVAETPLLRQYKININKSVLDQINKNKVTVYKLILLINETINSRSKNIDHAVTDLEADLFYNKFVLDKDPESEEDIKALADYERKSKEDFMKTTKPDERIFLEKVNIAFAEAWDQLENSDEASKSYFANLENIAFFDYEKMIVEEFMSL